MANELIPKNLNMLRYSLKDMTPEERRKLLALEESANSEDFMARQAMMGEQPSRQSPFQGMVMGNSGGYNVQLLNGQTVSFMPETLMARGGYQGDNLRGGASGVMVRMPDGSVQIMPGGIDAGYNTDLGNGGNLDIGGMYGPRGMFNVNARYTKKF
jgi:hypothetical protein